MRGAAIAAARAQCLRVAARILRDEHEAEDAVQDAALTMDADEFEALRSPGAWLVQVTKFRAVDRLKRRVRCPATLDAGMELRDVRALQPEHVAAVREAFDGFSARARAAFAEATTRDLRAPGPIGAPEKRRRRLLTEALRGAL